MNKTAKPIPALGTPEASPWDGDGNPKLLLAIPGLEPIRNPHPDAGTKGIPEYIFQLSGVTPVTRDWYTALNALGYEGKSDQERDEVAEQLGALLFSRDVMAVLKARVRPA